MRVSARRWVEELAGTMSRLAPDRAAALDLEAVAAAAAAVDVGGKDEDVGADDLELAGDFLLDVEQTKAAWLEASAARDPRCREAVARFHEVFRKDAGLPRAELEVARRDAVKELADAAGEALERRLRQLRWARERRERRADGRHLQLMSNQPAPGGDAWTLLAADEAATRAAEELKQALSGTARRALVELLRAPSDAAQTIAERHGISGATVSRAKTRLGHVAARVLADYPDAVRAPFWAALREALAG